MAESLDVKSIERDIEDEDEDYFHILTKSMVTNNVKKRVFFESFTDTDDDSHSTPEKKKKKEEAEAEKQLEYNASISSSAVFTELEQERRLLAAQLERVRWKVLIVRWLCVTKRYGGIL